MANILKILRSVVAGAKPTGKSFGELWINDADKKFGFIDSTGTPVEVGPTRVIEVTDNTNAALRITQLGTGNALLIEDIASPDPSPFVVDANGAVGIGTKVPAGALDISSTVTGGLIASQIFSAHNLANAKTNYVKIDASIAVNPVGAESGGYRLQVLQNNTYRTILDAGGFLGNKTNYLALGTTNEALRIDSAGQITQGVSTGASNGSLQLRRNITGGGTAYSVGVSTTVQSDVTGQASGYNSYINTAAASFTLPLLKHYNAQQGTFGAASAVADQYGFFADLSLVGATRNYGFFGDIPFGTDRYNFYAAGTANNYFQGSTFIGGKLGLDTKAGVGGTLPSAAASSYAQRVVAIAPSTSTDKAIGFQSILFTEAAAYTLATLAHFNAVQGTFGATLPLIKSAVTNQYGFLADASLVGATNNYGFYSDIAAATGRYNFYANGTAANYMAGSLGIGTHNHASAILDVQSTTHGVRLPRMTTVEKNAIASPAAGLIVFDITLSKLCVYTGAAWETITSA